MKKLVYNNKDSKEIEASRNTKKLKRTRESGHSYDYHVVFDNTEEMMEWWEEDKLYED